MANNIRKYIDKKALLIQNGFPCGNWNENGIGILQLRPFNVSNLGLINLNQKKYIEIEKNIKTYQVRYNDIIFTNTNSEILVGRTALWKSNENCVLSNHMSIIRVLNKEELSPSFLAHFLHYQWISGFSKSICRRHVNQASIGIDKLKAIELPEYSIFEQHKIAHVLNTVQKAIEQQDNLIRTTTELKKTLMQKLFTEGTRGEPQKETEIGLVPGSWEVKPFSEIFEIIKNQSHSRDKLTSEKTETKVLNIHYGDIHAKFKGNIVDLELEEVPYIIDEYVDEIKNNYLRDGDIVIADASEDLIDIGKCIELKNVKNRKIIGGLHTIIARNKKNFIQNGFGAYIFKNKYVSTELRFIANGLSVYGISKGNLLKMLIPIPPAQEQVEIGKTMDRCNKKIFFHQKKKQTLTTLFKTLLYELMTGQRRVHELEFEVLQSKTL